jgi:hypothetical protein
MGYRLRYVELRAESASLYRQCDGQLSLALRVREFWIREMLWRGVSLRRTPPFG